MAKVNDLSVTAGTQLKYKLEFANQAEGSKEARIRGVSLNINMPRKSAQTIAQERVGIRLSSHEKLCAERMLNLQKSIDRLEKS